MPSRVTLAIPMQSLGAVPFESLLKGSKAQFWVKEEVSSRR